MRSLLRVRDFRGYAAAEVRLGEGLTVIHGPNGAGKTNLLEALYFGCTGRSCRTSDERQLVRFEARPGGRARRGRRRATATATHELAVGFQPGEAKRFRVDGAPVDRLVDNPVAAARERVPARPARARQGPAGAAPRAPRPGRRRAVAVARGDAQGVRGRARRSATRSSRGSARAAPRASSLPRVGRRARPARDRAARGPRPGGRGAARAVRRGGRRARAQRRGARSRSARGPARRRVEELAAELAAGVDADLERGFTQRGPHRDDLALLRDGRPLRDYGSQGEQRIALLALLLAEREVLAAERDGAPLLLLDDVMSELDAGRREKLVERVRAGGQAVITTTDLAHVPGANDRGRRAHRGHRRSGPPGGRRRHEAARPVPVAGAVEALASRLEPLTPLASIQRAWTEAVGDDDRGRGGARLRAPRGGHGALPIGGLGATS